MVHRGGGSSVHAKEEFVIMTTKSKTSRTEVQATDQHLIDGLKKHEQALASLFIDGVSAKTADIVAVLQARGDAAKRTLATRATWQEAVLAERNERAKSKTLVSGLRQALKVAFANSPEALADFGLSPRKAAATTPEKRVAAAAKAKATRAARHTMGPKQKKAVKGTVPQTVPADGGAHAPAPAPATPGTAPGAAKSAS
jgi:hypothetical protein